MNRERPAGAHAPTGAPRLRHDGRSVGELLRDADYLARTLLMDLTAQDAPELLRSWNRLVEAAAGAWTTIERLSTNPSAQTRDANPDQRPSSGHDCDPMLRLHAVAGGIAVTLASARWPGLGPGSAVVEEIADNFGRATDLLDRSGVDLAIHRPEVQGDVAAAQMRLMHTVYLSSHAITSALQQHGRQLHLDGDHHQRTTKLGNPGLPYAIGPTGRWVQRIGVCEAIAGRYVRGSAEGFTAAVTGEVVPRLEDPGRLHHELARWDIQVHRSLAADPGPHNLVLACRTQAVIAGTALPLLTAAHHAGLVAEEDLEALTGAIETSGEAWNQLASRWVDLAPASARADSELTRAAADLRASVRDLIHNPVGNATSVDILARIDIARAVDSIQQALAAAGDVAHLIRDPASNPDLTGAARTLSVRAHNDTELQTATHQQVGPYQDVVWVRPADVLKNRNVPLPRPVSEGLIRASAKVIRTSQRAGAAPWSTVANNVASESAISPHRPHPLIPPGHVKDTPSRRLGR